MFITSPVENTMRSIGDGGAPLAEFFSNACIEYALLRKAA